MKDTRVSISCSQRTDEGVIEKMNIFVTGGSGYIGQPLVRNLIDVGHHVTVLTRNESYADGLPAQAEIVTGDLFDNTSLQLGMSEADSVIHLVGIIREDRRKEQTMNRVHVQGTVQVIEAARRAGVHRFLHMSALGARADARSDYHRSKWEAEKRVRQSGLGFTIFRPSVVYGPGGPRSNFLRQLADMVRKAPIVPVIGHGDFSLQPVHTSTLSDMLTQAVRRDDTIGETFEVCGSTVVTYESILRDILSVLDLHKPAVHLPLPFIEALTRSLGRFRGFPLTHDQFTMLVEGNVCASESRLYGLFDLEPIPFVITRDLLE